MTYKQELIIAKLSKEISMSLNNENEKLEFLKTIKKLQEIYYKMKHDKEIAIRCFKKNKIIIETIIEAEIEYQKAYENILIELFKNFPSIAIVIMSLFYTKYINISRFEKYLNAEGWSYIVNNQGYDINKLIEKYSDKLIKYNLINGYRIFKRIYKKQNLTKQNKLYFNNLITSEDTKRYKKLIIEQKNYLNKVDELQKIKNHDSKLVQKYLDKIMPYNGIRRITFHNKVMDLECLNLKELEIYTLYFLDDVEDIKITKHLEKVRKFENEFSNKLTPEIKKILKKTNLKLWDY